MSTSEKNELAINKIQRHDFEAAKNALEAYTKENNKSVSLPQVSTEGGLFGWFSHKVEGEELNGLTAKIQTYLINLNGVDNELFEQIRQVYRALDALDSEYITAILDSIEAIKVVNNKTRDNQKDIKDTIANQEKTIKVLERHRVELSEFKNKISKLEHIMDVDKAWESINTQKEIIAFLKKNADELLKIRHLKDVDTIWQDGNSAKKRLDGVESNIADINDKLDIKSKAFNEFKEKLSAILHIYDVDDIWKDVQKHEQELINQDDKINQSTMVIEKKIENTYLTIQTETQDNLSIAISNTAKIIDEQKAYFTKKINIAYAIAGAAVTISLIHIILSLVGLI